PNGDQFYIYFEYVHHQITPSPTEPDAESITTINRTLLIPREILCNCDEETVTLDNDNTTFLYESFSFVPVPVQRLQEILPPIGEYAREIVAAHQGHNVWEMKVTLHVTSWPDEDDEDDDDYIDLSEYEYVLQSTSQIAESTSEIVDLLKEVESTELPFYSTDQCAICLEEFGTGSKLGVVSTECLHRRVVEGDELWRALRPAGRRGQLRKGSQALLSLSRVALACPRSSLPLRHVQALFAVLLLPAAHLRRPRISIAVASQLVLRKVQEIKKIKVWLCYFVLVRAIQ
ncbi:hypothetical protein CR513_60871, partial [Mucuna pruriens]